MTHSSIYVEADWHGFDPTRIQSVRHRLVGHPALQLPALIELGKRLEPCGGIRTHSSSATAGTAFNHAPQLHPNIQGASATLSDIEHAQAWMSLLNVQTDPQYRELIERVLGSLKPHVDAVDPGMCYRAGWIFVSSPGAITPFHMDKEHNFILQVRGRKKLYVWDPRDTVVVSEHARDRFHRGHSRDLVQWREEFRPRAQVFDLTPGMGAYMPSTSPHMVENGDEASITMSFTYYTRATRRDAQLHRTHEMMRQFGMAPPAVGRYPMLDVITYAAARMYAGAKRVGRLRGSESMSSDSLPYAIPGRT